MCTQTFYTQTEQHTEQKQSVQSQCTDKSEGRLNTHTKKRHSGVGQGASVCSSGHFTLMQTSLETMSILD